MNPGLAAPDARPVLVHTEELTRYSFGPDHPMGPDRVRLAMELAAHTGTLDAYDVVEPHPASDGLLRLVHSPRYLAALADGHEHPEYGIGGEDNPVVPGLPAVASRIAAASATAAELVWTGLARRAVSISGGLHHAMPASAHGFCLYNDAAVAIAWLLAHGARRVAYLDLDAHHGDGVELAFWNDPRVLTISVHETGIHLFPGPAMPMRSVARTRGVPRSTSRCLRTPVTCNGCAPPMPWCRRCSPPSSRRCWSASTAPTRMGVTR